ncbi:MAG TPA: sigma-54 dependent transcriptional regulator [Polyangiaceae bacterium]
MRSVNESGEFPCVPAGASGDAAPSSRGVRRYGELVGCSSAMAELFAVLARLEKSLATVLLHGESGTGKELCARAIHQHSRVSTGPFLSVNCGVLDRTLARSELFGHERGSFTGASEKRRGYFQEASGGTLFLDEIGELPLDVQPVLLRALETRSVTPVGGTSEVPVDVRIVAASNRRLDEEVAAGRFREDLYYRIRVVQLELPPLRERPLDVRVLAKIMATRQGAGPLPDAMLDRLAAHPWPGNVRELRNAVETYLAVGKLQLREPAKSSNLEGSLSRFVDPKLPYADQKERLLAQFSRIYLTELLKSTAGNQSEAARVSGLERSYLGKLLAKLDVPRATST